ncbi:MAG TPA: cytidylate kinase-like family protein [Azospirillum sp.]|nr:cytidylate kinase-like family protein [Azospirillum sp.]
MAKNDPLHTLLAFMAADRYQPQTPPSAERPPVITVARSHGSGGEAIAARVAATLGMACFDKELMDGVVGAAQTDKAAMRTLDEKLPVREGTFLFASLLGLNDPLPEYQRTLARVVKGIAWGGGVIVGRGAHLILRGTPCFRVRIVGSEDVCARRLAAGDAARVPALLGEVRTVNLQRTRFLAETFKVPPDEPLQYDLVVNTDGFGDLDGVADLVVQAFRGQRRPA